MRRRARPRTALPNQAPERLQPAGRRGRSGGGDDRRQQDGEAVAAQGGAVGAGLGGEKYVEIDACLSGQAGRAGPVNVNPAPARRGSSGLGAAEVLTTRKRAAADSPLSEPKS
jgi:hypothetical protein